MSRSCDVTLLTLAALDEARQLGYIVGPRLLSIEARKQVDRLRLKVPSPKRAEVSRTLGRLATGWNIPPEDVSIYTDMAMHVMSSEPFQRHGFCELLDELFPDARDFSDWLNLNGGYRQALKCKVHQHHIWGGKTRIDAPSNMLRICAIVHLWVHEVAPVEGRMACIWKRSTLPLFSWAELDRCAGLKVKGWVWSHEMDREPYITWRQEILSTL